MNANTLIQMISLGAAGFGLLMLVINLFQMRKENWLRPLQSVLIVLCFAFPTALLLVAAGGMLNYVTAAVFLALGLLIGLLIGARVKMRRVPGGVMGKRSRIPTLMWGLASLASPLMARLGSPAWYALGLMGVVFGLGLVMGCEGVLFLRTLLQSRGAQPQAAYPPQPVQAPARSAYPAAPPPAYQPAPPPVYQAVETLQQQPAAMGPARLLVPVPGTNQMMAVNLPADRLMIGREPDCGVVLNDAEVSRRHAAVEFMHGGYWVTDLSSANGTFINGQRVQRQVLRPNDQVMLGSTILVFQVGGAPVERRCPACGRVVPPGKPFCLHDGTPVDGA